MAHKRILIIAAVLAFVVAAGVSASPRYIDSPESLATAGRFGGDAGDFLAPRYYSGVEFEKFFGVVSFVSNISGNFNPYFNDFTNKTAQLGAAFRFGDAYLGLYYGGNPWEYFGANSTMYKYTEVKEGRRTFRVYESIPQYTMDRGRLFYNEAAVLIGVSDMGIRLAFASDYETFKLEEKFRVAGGGDAGYYKSLETAYGHINPEIVWGMAKDIIPDRGIRPELSLGTDFYIDYIKRDKYSGDFSSQTAGKEVNRSQNYLRIDIGAALGGFTITQINNFKFGVDMGYGAGIRQYINNEYSYNSNGKNKIKQFTFSGYKDSGGLYYGKTMNDHTITPSLSAEWEWDRVDLSSSLELGMIIENEKQSIMQFKAGTTNGTLVKQGDDYNKTGFKFGPTLNLGMRWGVVPGKFFLNAGSGISFGSVEFVSTQQKLYANDRVVSGSAFKTVENKYSGASTTLSTGVSFYPVENVGIHAVCGIDSGKNAVNVFGTEKSSGLFNFMNILVTVKK